MKGLFQSGIVGTGSYVPEKVVKNSDLEKIVDTSDEWIVTRTGIRERRIAESCIATSDMAAMAAERALADAGIAASDVDLIMVATTTPDMYFPSTACIVQELIGAKRAAAFDLEAACSGFIYGLVIANQFIATGLYNNILLIGAETLSRFVNWKDRNTCVLFGDGAGAVVVSRVEEGYGILSQYMGADGRGANLLLIDAGGSRRPTCAETLEQELHYIRMNGGEVFKFAVNIMAYAGEEAVRLAGLTQDDIDCMIPHQANIRIIEAARKRLGLSKDKIYVNLDRYGNMSSASIPIALDEAVTDGLVKRGDNVVLVAFGAGLTWASALIKWAKLKEKLYG